MCICLWDGSSTLGAVGIVKEVSAVTEPDHSIHAGNSKIHLYLKAASIYSRIFKVQTFWRMFINKSADTVTCSSLQRQKSILNASLFLAHWINKRIKATFAV